MGAVVVRIYLRLLDRTATKRLLLEEKALVGRLFQYTQFASIPLIRLAARSTPFPEVEGFYSRAAAKRRKCIAASAHRTEGFSLGRSSAAGGDEGVSCAVIQATSHAAFPLIRLVVRSTPFPEGEGFYSCALSPCLAVLTNNRNQPLPLPAPTHARRATPSFISLTFTSHAAFFDSFLGSKKESYSLPSSYTFSVNSASAAAAA